MLQQVRGFKFRTLVSLFAAFAVWASPSAVRAQQPIVDKLVLDGTIQPVSAGMLKRAIEHAE